MVATHRFAAALGLSALCAAPLAAQRHVPATYAVTGARIVPVSGPVIDKGTVVIRDGVIAAVGATVAVPADAQVIDGAGLSVYPGLIDAYSSLGQPAPVANTAAGGRGGGRGATLTAAPTRADDAPNSNYVTGLRPEVDVVDAIELEPDQFDAAHTAGITTALTGVSNGIFRGQAALINLHGDSVSMMVIKDGIAQSIGFSRGGGGGFGGGGRGYPGTLFGAFASLRQELYDAQHYRDVMAAYARDPRGTRRPAFDASLAALQPVIAGKQPVILQANTEREIIRALDLAKEFNLKAMIGGGAEAYKVAARLKADNVPVLLTLNFPRRGTATGGGRGGRGGGASADEPEPLRMLRDRVMAPKGPQALAKAGVTFTFESGDDYTNMLANLRKAVAAGLPADQAIRAITWQAADLFGVSDRLGSIETGKIANLTIARGDLLDADGHVTELFIDGEPVMVKPPAAAAAGGRGARAGFGADGAWYATVSIDGHDANVTLHLRQDQDRIYGVVQGDLGAGDIANGTLEPDGSLYFTATLSLVGGTAEVEFDGTLDEHGLRGTVSAEGHQDGSFTGAHQ